MTQRSPEALQAENLFSMYPRLAARVTNLRTIIQDPETHGITEADAAAWVEDVKSVMNDFMSLSDQTALLVRHFIKDSKS